ncbi:MAG: hypothetical protein WCB53_05655 [Terriglobales bacterium]
MTEQTVLNFVDPYEGNCVAIVRIGQNERVVGIALSVQSNGDIEAFMPIADAERFVQAILQAIDRVKNSEKPEP